MTKTILKFEANWCGPCRTMTEELRKAGLDYEAVDIDADPERAASFNIRGIPTLVFLEDGVEVRRITGMKTAGELEALGAI